jgi:hypothetical protein
MPKRTSPNDASRIVVASDLEEIVIDKREGWRASDAKARRRQRRYKRLLTQQLIKMVPIGDAQNADDVEDLNFNSDLDLG